MGLVLNRKIGEQISIEDGRIIITVLSKSGNSVSLHFEADESIKINRHPEEIKKEKPTGVKRNGERI